LRNHFVSTGSRVYNVIDTARRPANYWACVSGRDVPVSVPPMMNAIFRARHSDKAGDRQRANAMIFLIGGGGGSGSARSIAFPVGLTPPATTTTTTTTTLTDSLLSGSLLSSPAICTITIGNGKFLDRRRCRCFVWTISSRRLNWQTEKSPTHPHRLR